MISIICLIRITIIGIYQVFLNGLSSTCSIIGIRVGIQVETHACMVPYTFMFLSQQILL
ncbi:Hypothetical predicted protein [Prunus dulcis]|uniref:Uncharacterized protein n=1 Tax=Prunus dulcis TaxID=3755 RepID=A0A5E4G369_PRUDU|nr:Hypothetical predicted protein [Prunus dulcis]